MSRTNKRVYIFDQRTKLFITYYDCQLDPLEKGENGEDLYITPEASTPIQPPDFNASENTCIWDDGQWNLFPVVIETPEGLTPLSPQTAEEKFSEFLNANPDVRVMFGL